LFVDPALYATSSVGETPVQQPTDPAWWRDSNSVFLDLVPGLDETKLDRSEIRVPVFVEVVSGSSPLPAGSELVRIPPPPCPPGTRPALETDLCGAVVPQSWLDALERPEFEEPEGLLRVERAHGLPTALDPPWNEDVPSDEMSLADAVDHLLDGLGDAVRVGYASGATPPVDDAPDDLAAELPPGSLHALRAPTRRGQKLRVTLVDAGFQRTRAAHQIRLDTVDVPAEFRLTRSQSDHGDAMCEVLTDALERFGVDVHVDLHCIDVAATWQGGPLWMLLGMVQAIHACDLGGGESDRGVVRDPQDHLVLTALAFRTPCSGESLFDRAVSRLASSGASIVAAAGNKRVAWHQGFLQTWDDAPAAPGPIRISVSPDDEGEAYALELYVAEPSAVWRLEIAADRVRYEPLSLAPIRPTDRVERRDVNGPVGADPIRVLVSGDGDDELRVHLALPSSLRGAPLWLGVRAGPEWNGSEGADAAPRIGIATRPTSDAPWAMRLGELASGRVSGPGSPACASGIVAVGGYYQPVPHQIIYTPSFAGPHDLFGRHRRFLYAGATNLPSSAGGVVGGSSAATMLVGACMASVWASSPDARMADVEDATLASSVTSGRAGAHGVLVAGLVDPVSVIRPRVMSVAWRDGHLIVETDRVAVVVVQFGKSSARLRCGRFEGTVIGVTNQDRRVHRCAVPDSLMDCPWAIYVRSVGAPLPTCIDGGGAGLRIERPDAPETPCADRPRSPSN